MAVGFAVQVALPSTTNLPADDVVNTFAFSALASPITGAGLVALFEDFYNNDTGIYQSIADYISPTISRARAVTVKGYDLADPEPRSPVAEGSFTLGASGSGTAYPDEVALCLSYGGSAPSGTNPARRRGRVFIGPFNDLVTYTNTGNALPAPALQQTLLNAGERLWDLSQGTWWVHSRADDELFPLNRLWVDNAWDTQRRRGRRATSRATRTLI